MNSFPHLLPLFLLAAFSACTPNSVAVVPNPAIISKEAVVPFLDAKTITVHGQLIVPDGSPIEKKQISIVEYASRSISHASATIKDDALFSGTFTFKMRENAECFLEQFKSPPSKWVIPLTKISSFGWDGKESVTVPIILTEAIKVNGIVKDKETGKPLPGICLTCIPIYDGMLAGSAGNGTINHLILTNDEGRFETSLPAGKYVFALDTAIYGHRAELFETQKELSAFRQLVSVENNNGKPLEATFEFPKLYSAKLLSTDGSPAPYAHISFNGYNGKYLYTSTRTNNQGLFYFYQVPQSIEMTVNSPAPYDKNEERLHLWFEETATKAPDGEIETFHLRKPGTIRARFVDETTGQALTDIRIDELHHFKPGAARNRFRHSFSFAPEESSVPGEFIFRNATPGVEYHFSGRNGSNYCRDVLTATVSDDGQYLDLGDVPFREQRSALNEQLNKFSVTVYNGHNKVERFRWRKEELSSHSIGTSLGETTNGTCVLFANQDTCLLGLRDPENQWAAEPMLFKTSKDVPEEIRFDVRRGELLRGTLLDETTGKPLSDMPITVTQLVHSQQDSRLTLSWKLTTDSQGRFEIRLTEGDIVLNIESIDWVANTFYPFLKEIRPPSPWVRTLRLEQGKPVDLKWSIPSPFVGKVLTSSGKPAAKASVVVCWPHHQVFQTGVLTNKEGEFKFAEMPKSGSYLRFQASSPHSRDDDVEKTICWFTSEEQQTEFRLSNIEMTGRFVDSVTGQPCADWREETTITAVPPKELKGARPAEWVQSVMIQSDSNGHFRFCGLVPNVEYRFQFGEHDAKEIISVTPATTGNVIFLGDITVK